MASTIIRSVRVFTAARSSLCLLKSSNLPSVSRAISTCNPLLAKDNDKEELENNPYYEKYADKIKQVKSKERKRGVKKDKRLLQEMEKWRRYNEMLEGKFTSATADADDGARGSKLPKTLNELMKMELLEDKSADEIAAFWTEYYKQQECISAVIPKDMYENLLKRAVENPVFLYPLPKEQGYEFVLAQFDKHRCFFTSLINYQVHGENAPWQLCLTHYTDIMDDKGIVLMTSEMDTNTMNVMEAQYLTQLLQLFYVTPTEERYALVDQFNHLPDSFKYMDVVKEVEKSNMVAKPKSE